MKESCSWECPPVHPAAEKVAPIMGEAELEELAAAEINRLHGEVGEDLRLTVEKTSRKPSSLTATGFLGSRQI